MLECSAIEFESPKQSLSRFRSGLRDDYHWEFIAETSRPLEQSYQLITDLDESRGSYFHRTDSRDGSETTASKSRFNRSFPTLSRPASNSSSVKPVGPSSAKPTTFEKRTSSEPMKVNSHTQCYRCQGHGHFVIQCLSQTKNILVKVSIEDVE